MPANPTFYMQPCPVCGRSLRVPVRLLGKTVACHHCEATFMAYAAGGSRVPACDPSMALLKRADELLNTCYPHHRVGLVDSAMQEPQS